MSTNKMVNNSVNLRSNTNTTLVVVLEVVYFLLLPWHK